MQPMPATSHPVGYPPELASASRRSRVMLWSKSTLSRDGQTLDKTSPPSRDQWCRFSMASMLSATGSRVVLSLSLLRRLIDETIMRYARLKERLAERQTIILDGPTGTELQRRGAPMDVAAWCGPATLDHERLLTAIHTDYIRAGADVITANTYASSRLMLADAGLADRVDEINRRAIAAALRARDTAPNGDTVVVAGSLSHMVPIRRGARATDPE